MNQGTSSPNHRRVCKFCGPQRARPAHTRLHLRQCQRGAVAIVPSGLAVRPQKTRASGKQGVRPQKTRAQIVTSNPNTNGKGNSNTNPAVLRTHLRATGAQSHQPQPPRANPRARSRAPAGLAHRRARTSPQAPRQDKSKVAGFRPRTTNLLRIWGSLEVGQGAGDGTQFANPNLQPVAHPQPPGQQKQGHVAGSPFAAKCAANGHPPARTAGAKNAPATGKVKSTRFRPSRTRYSNDLPRG
jgi:hypothetical protein